MAKTYTPIATSTMTVNAPSITFSSIPAGYTDLKLIITFKRDNAGGVYLRFNSDSASNYSQTFLEGASTAVSVRAANQNFAYVDYNGDSTNNGMYSIDLMNYSNTTTFKTYLASAGNAATAIDKTVGLLTANGHYSYKITYYINTNGSILVQPLCVFFCHQLPGAPKGRISELLPNTRECLCMLTTASNSSGV